LGNPSARCRKCELRFALARDEQEPGKPLNGRAVKYPLVTLRAELESAVRDELIQRNVANLVDPPGIAKRQMTTSPGGGAAVP
jgi:hypothetical protein